MKRIFLLLSVSLIFGIACLAQKNVTTAWGPTYKMPSKFNTKIVCEDKDGFYVLRSQRRSSKGVILEKYDKKMNLKFSEELIIPKKDKELMLFEDVIYINKQLILLTSYFDKQAKKNFYFAHPIDEKGKVGSKFKLLDENKTDGVKWANYDFEMSDDTTKMLLYYNPTTNNKKDDEIFHYKVFDQSFNLIWEKEVELPYKDKLVSIQDYIIDNDANVHMLLTIAPDRTKGERETKEEQAKKFMVLGYNHKTGQFSQYEIKLNDKWVASFDYDYNPQLNQLILGGFYSNDFKMWSIDGLFYMKLDLNTGEVQKSSIKQFDKDFMVDMLGEKKADKGKGIEDFKIRHFFSKNDGGAYIVAEQYYITVTTTTDANGNTSTRTTYHYNHIITASINSSGEIEWLKKITKRSADGSDGYYLSYAINHNRQKDDLNIIFNDNPKNIEKYKEDPNKLVPVGNVKKAIATWVHINKEGKMNRVPLFGAKDLDQIILQPRTHMRTENDITVYGIKGKEYKFGKITFK